VKHRASAVGHFKALHAREHITLEQTDTQGIFVAFAEKRNETQTSMNFFEKLVQTTGSRQLNSSLFANVFISCTNRATKDTTLRKNYGSPTTHSFGVDLQAYN